MERVERVLWASVIGFLLLAARALAGPQVPIITTFDEAISGGTIVEGLQANDALGSVLLEIGDVDGDDLTDLAFAARNRSDRGYDGRVLLGFRWLDARLDLDEWSIWGIELSAENRLAWPRAGLGDLDGDGFDDLGFPTASEGLDAGVGVILFGGPALPSFIDADTFDGSRKARILPDTSLIPAGPIWGFQALGSGELDGDGRRDLVVSVRHKPDPESIDPEGLVFLVPGVRPFPEEIRLADVGAVSGCRIRASGDASDRFKNTPHFGKWVAAADFDLDGIDDLVLSTPNWAYDRDGTVRHAPAVMVIFGRESWPGEIDAADQAEPGICRIVSASDAGRLAEYILEVPGDLTGDSVPDLLVSVSLRDEPGSYLVSGARMAPGLLVLEDVAEAFFASKETIERIVDLGDWDGDGSRELAFGLPGRGNGSVIVLPVEDPIPARTSLDERFPASLEITGVEPGARFGQELVGADLDGDGRREIAASAPGNTRQGTEMQIRGRLAILHGEADFLGPLGGEYFAPKKSELRGGGVLDVRGKGFDGATEVYLGDVRLEVLERLDSRSLKARIPPRDTAGSLPVRLRRGADGFDFPEPFAYFEGLFPAEVDVSEAGEGWCTIVNHHMDPGGDGCGFDEFSTRIRGGHDFTGDGLADVLFALRPSAPDSIVFCPGKVFLLHGSPGFPLELRTDAIEDRATVIESEVPFDFRGWRNTLDAILVGDMTGDGRSELAIGATASSAVYIFYGHDVPPGPVTVQELFRNGRGCRIEGLPKTTINPDIAPDVEESQFDLIEAGDVDGDGLRDLGINLPPLDIGDTPAPVGCLALVLGRRSFPEVLGFADLPKVYGKLPLVDGATAQIREATDGVGDVDGDGFDDIAMRCQSHGDIEEGYFGYFDSWFILFGRSTWPAVTVIDDDLEAGGSCEVVRVSWMQYSNDWVVTVAGIGDEDRDGKDDLGLKVLEVLPAGLNYDFRLIYGSWRDELDQPRDPRKRDDFDAVFPVSSETHASISLRRGGRDLNGDGIPEVLISDVHSPLNKPPPSRAMVLFGGNLREREAPLDDLDGVFQILNRRTCPALDPWGCSFPIGFHFGGDVNGDRREDLVLFDKERVRIYFNPLGPLDRTRPFRRGDSNSDGVFDLSDAVGVLGFLFLGGAEPACLDAADIDDDESLDISDGIRLLGWLFLGGEPPAPPRDCAPDPGGEALECRESPCP
jgi:hypothetical protein